MDDQDSRMTQTTTARSPTFGMLAFALGFLAFAGVVGHFFSGPIDPPAPLEVSIADKAAAIRDATVAALKGEEYEAAPRVRERTLDDYLTFAFLALAAGALLLSAIGFVRHEPWRPSVVGVAFAGLALSFQFAVVLFFALLFAVMLSAVIDKLDFSL